MTRVDCSENEPPWVPSSWWATQFKKGPNSDRGNAETLRNYWLYGEGAAKIGWGTEGDWRRCVSHLTKYLGPRAKGYCQELHEEANGFYTGDKRNK